jgi:Flp pilus assembly protein TadB
MTPDQKVARLRIEPRPEFAAILREERYAANAVVPAADSAERINRAFDRLLLQSGTRLSGNAVLRLSLWMALVGGGWAFVFSRNLLATAMVVGVASLVPVVVLAIRRGRRQTQMEAQFAAFVEQLLRKTRAGGQLAVSLDQIAERTPAPLGTELRQALRRTELGLALGEALAELPERTGLTGMQVLVAAIRLSERHGGDLAPGLDRLAASLRERAREDARRSEASTAEWAAGVLVFLLQAVVVWLFITGKPQQLSQFAASRSNLAALAAAGAILIAVWYCVLRLSTSRRRA